MTAAAPAATPAWPRRKATHRRLLLVFLVALGVLVGLGVVGIVLGGDETAAPACSENLPCGRPPSAEPAILTGRVWRSPVGVQMEYYPSEWRVLETNERQLALVTRNGAVLLDVRAFPAAEATPAELIRDRIGDLRGRIPTVTEDTDPSHKLLAPHIGSVRAEAATYSGTIETPQQGNVKVQLFVEAASDGRASVVVLALTSAPEQGAGSAYSPFPVFGVADTLLNTFRWASEGPQGARS